MANLINYINNITSNNATIDPASSKPIPTGAEIYYYLITIPIFIVYIFIIIVLIIAREKLTIHSFFKIQTLPLGIIYTISNLNLYGPPENTSDLTPFCKFMTNIRSIVFIIILGIQTFQMVFTLSSLYWSSFLEKHNKSISIMLHVLCHIMWIIMLLLGIKGSKYERNMALGLCKFKNEAVTLYRTILYIVYAIIYAFSFFMMIYKVKKNLKESQDNTMFLKYKQSFKRYLIGLILYLFTYLSITIMMALEGFTQFKVSFNTRLGAFMWFIRVFSQCMVPVVASWINCVTQSKINKVKAKIYGGNHVKSDQSIFLNNNTNLDDIPITIRGSTQEILL